MSHKRTDPIEGLLVKPLERFWDERGDFRELVRNTDPGFPGFSQLMSSVVHEGIAKAWHLHWKQTELMTILLGTAKFAFADRRKDSDTFGAVADFLIDAKVNPVVFTIPPGVAHGYRIVHGSAVIAYLANALYDPTDQIKIPHDDKEIAYNWHGPDIV